MKFPIIVVDLDGTLLNSKKQVSERNYNAIMNCSRNGMKFIFATARPPRAVNSFLDDDLFKIGGSVK